MHILAFFGDGNRLNVEIGILARLLRLPTKFLLEFKFVALFHPIWASISRAGYSKEASELRYGSFTPTFPLRVVSLLDWRFDGNGYFYKGHTCYVYCVVVDSYFPIARLKFS